MVTTVQRQKVIDYTHPFVDVQMVFQTCLPKEIVTYDTLILPYDVTTWICIMLCTLLIIFCLTIADWQGN